MPIRGSPNGARHPRPQAGRDRPERVVAINRNDWSQSIGTAGRDHPVRARQQVPVLPLGEQPIMWAGLRYSRSRQRVTAGGASPRTASAPRGRKSNRAVAAAGFKRRRREQPSFQLALVDALRHEPGDADYRRPSQILAHRRSTGADLGGDSPLAHAQGVAQSEARTFRIGALSAGIELVALAELLTVHRASRSFGAVWRARPSILKLRPRLSSHSSCAISMGSIPMSCHQAASSPLW